MSQNRTRHTAEFTARVALAALTEAKTLAEISSEYKVHSTQITRWKQEGSCPGRAYSPGLTMYS